jgi:dimethylglycine dehydrogenase
MRWFERHLPADGSVRVHRFHTDLVGLMLAGRNRARCWRRWWMRTCRTQAFRFMDFREMDVAGAPCMVNRITYTGDLGYEIWMKPAFERRVYLAIKEAGAAHGIVDFGMRALLSMRLEKNFPTWFAELRPIYGPFEGAMERFVKLQKPDFIGRAAAVAERDAGPKLRRVSLMIDAADADVMGDEPIWAKVDTDYGAIEPPHGYGAPRFDAEGTEVPSPRSGARRRLAGRRLGDLGRLRALGSGVDGAGLSARGPGRARRGGSLRGRDHGRAAAGADRAGAALRCGRREDADVTAGAGLTFQRGGGAR